jgi:hypothetical protein
MAEVASPQCLPEPGCPEWLYATIELPPGKEPQTIDLASLRLAGEVGPDPSFSRFSDRDHDGVRELEVRFALARVMPLLSVGPNDLSLTGRAGQEAIRGTGSLLVRPDTVALHLRPSVIHKRRGGPTILARLTFQREINAREVDSASLRLDGVVPIKRVECAHENHITVTFDRAAVAAILPLGRRVEVEVGGTIRGLAFEARAFVQVME